MFPDRVDYFIKFMIQSNLFCFKLISTLSLTYRHCRSMKITGEAKPSEAEAAESELSASLTSVDERKKEEKSLVLSSDLAELVVDTKEDKQTSGDDEWVE